MSHTRAADASPVILSPKDEGSFAVASTMHRCDCVDGAQNRVTAKDPSSFACKQDATLRMTMTKCLQPFIKQLRL